MRIKLGRRRNEAFSGGTGQPARVPDPPLAPLVKVTLSASFPAASFGPHPQAASDPQTA